MSDIRDEVRHYIGENFVMGNGGTTFSDADSLIELQIMDSTGFLEMVIHLEGTYGVSITEMEMTRANLDSLDSIATFIGRKRATAASGKT